MMNDSPPDDSTEQTTMKYSPTDSEPATVKDLSTDDANTTSIQNTHFSLDDSTEHKLEPATKKKLSIKRLFRNGDKTKQKLDSFQKDSQDQTAVDNQLSGDIFNSEHTAKPAMKNQLHGVKIDRSKSTLTMPSYYNRLIHFMRSLSRISAKSDDSKSLVLYTAFIGLLEKFLPLEEVIDAVAGRYKLEQDFVRSLAIFLTSFIKSHIEELESDTNSKTALITGLDYLTSISSANDTNLSVICFDFWKYFLTRVEAQSNDQMELYGSVLSNLRNNLISYMPKPKEVLIVIEDGRIFRETSNVNDVLIQYKNMSATLISLSRIDPGETEKKMLEKVNTVDEAVSWNIISPLCWAIGSLAGSMKPEQRNKSLLTIIQKLMKLYTSTNHEDAKTIIASNLIYVVGQSHGVLKVEWKLMKACIQMLFGFMYGKHPGVQDMACATMLKIVGTYKTDFVIVQAGETESFVDKLLSDQETIFGHLEARQLRTCYDAVKMMIEGESDFKKRKKYNLRLRPLLLKQQTFEGRLSKVADVGIKLWRKIDVQAVWSMQLSVMGWWAEFYNQLIDEQSIHKHRIALTMAAIFCSLLFIVFLAIKLVMRHRASSKEKFAMKFNCIACFVTAGSSLWKLFYLPKKPPFEISVSLLIGAHLLFDALID